MLRLCVLTVPLTLGVLLAVGCGSADSSPVADETPLSFGQRSNDGPCTSDAECAPGESCLTVRIGEQVLNRCVPQTATSPAVTPAHADASTSAAPDASREAAAPIADGGSPDVVLAPVDGGGGNCTLALRVSISASGPAGTCIYNTTVEASSPATLFVPCEGDGPAHVTFGDQTFTGTLTAGQIALDNVDTYTVMVPNTGTSCEYTSSQAIDGALASGTLAYTYTEVLSPGQSAICRFTTLACYQSGPVSVASQ